MRADERCQKARHDSVVAYLRMKRGSGKYVLWVEGPDDCVVLERFAAPGCSVKDLAGKKFVIRAVKEALAARLDGFLGLVDRDFDHLHQEPAPLRLALISRKYSDLESSMLAHAADELLADLIRKDFRGSIEWLSEQGVSSSLGQLAAFAVAPVGALRRAWIGRTDSIDYLRHPVDEALSRFAPGERPTAETLATVLVACSGLAGAECERISAEAMKLYRTSDPWQLVRGKDMVRAIAVVLSRRPEACFYSDADLRAIERKIQEKVVTLFDFEILHAAGTHAEMRSALEPVGECLSSYLMSPRGS